MLVLGIETSCDETACALVEDGDHLLSSVLSSQTELQAQFNGVVPEVACRRHVEAFIPVLERCLEQAGCQLDDVDTIAVTQGPGLSGALMVGINAAKGLALALDRPLVGVNHIEAHLYAAIMGRLDEVRWPALGVVISGGHTLLCEMPALGEHRIVAGTVDDAIGEAFDKVAVQLGLGYPGGALVERVAQNGTAGRFPLKAGTVKAQPLGFSFSGLKTAVMHVIREQKSTCNVLSEQTVADIAASFQEVALTDLITKVLAAAEQIGAKSIILGGGVTANRRLRNLFVERVGARRLFWPGAGLSTDNAAMIAGLGFHVAQRMQNANPFLMDAFTQLRWD